MSASLPSDLKATVSLNYSTLQIFFPALAAGEDLLTPEERRGLDPLRAPDTVLYNYGKPIERYAFDAAKGSVGRVARRLTTEGIWDDFSLAQCPATRRSAMWIEAAGEAVSTTSQRRDILVDVACQEPGPASLRVFLQRLKGRGMLQQVVETKRESDGTAKCVMLLCHYSPHRFSVDKLTSLFLISGPGGAEAPPPLSLVFSPHFGTFHATAVPASRTFTQLKRHCSRVALCLGRLYSAEVVSMTLGFRFGADEGLYLSWCDSVSLCLLGEKAGAGTFVIDAHGARAVGGPPPPRALRDTKFSLRDPKDAPTPCDICGDSAPRGALCRVQLRWLLMALSLMDPYVAGWEGEVPPSVALVCPDMTVEGFAQLKETIVARPMFRLVCGYCFGRAEASITRMTDSKMRAPAWLGVDAAASRRPQQGPRLLVGSGHRRPQSPRRPAAPPEPFVAASLSPTGDGGCVLAPLEALPLYTHSEGRWAPLRGQKGRLVVPRGGAAERLVAAETFSDVAHAEALQRALERLVASASKGRHEPAADEAPLLFAGGDAPTPCSSPM